MKKFNKSHENENKNKDQLIIYGRHAVLSALKNPKRRIQKLLITAENRAEIEKNAPNIPYIITDKKEFSRILGDDSVHQGFALFCSLAFSNSFESKLMIFWPSSYKAKL